MKQHSEDNCLNTNCQRTGTFSGQINGSDTLAVNTIVSWTFKSLEVKLGAPAKVQLLFTVGVLYTDK